MRYVVDTNFWIKFLRKQPYALQKLKDTLEAGDEIVISPIVYFELMRGAVKRDDEEIIGAVRNIKENMTYFEMTDEIWEIAAKLWADAVKRNKRQDDADTLIAAFAIHLDATVVTENEKHFKEFPVRVENWNA